MIDDTLPSEKDTTTDSTSGKSEENAEVKQPETSDKRDTGTDANPEAGKNADIAEEKSADVKAPEAAPADTEQKPENQPEQAAEPDLQTQEATLFSMQNKAIVPSSQTRILTNLSLYDDSMSWPGSGTEQDPKVYTDNTTKDTFTAQTFDSQATINDNGDRFDQPMNIGTNVINLKVTARDTVTITYYQILVERTKSAQNDYPHRENFSPIPASAADTEDGGIAGFDPSLRYDYQKNGSADRIPIPENASEVTGLGAGTYKIRYGETDTMKAGNNFVQVTVPYGGPYTIEMGTWLKGDLTTRLEATDISFPATAAEGSLVTLSMTLPKNDLFVTAIDCKQKVTSGLYQTLTKSVQCTFAPDGNGKYRYNLTFEMPGYNTILWEWKELKGTWYTAELDDSMKSTVNSIVTPANPNDRYTSKGISYYKGDSTITSKITLVNSGKYTVDKVIAKDKTTGKEITSSPGNELTFAITGNVIITAELTLIPADFTKLNELLAQIPTNDLMVLDDSSQLKLAPLLAQLPNMWALSGSTFDKMILDNYVKNLEAAVASMTYRDADLTGLNEQLQRIPADLGIYTPDTVQILDAAKLAAQEPSAQNWDIRRQDEVDALAETLKNAIDGLKKIPAATPAKPELLGKTDLTITVNALPGQEYSIDNGNTWVSDGVFTNLAPSADYQIITRVLETNTSGMSDASEPLTVTTEKSNVTAPAKPALQKVTADSITVEAVNGQEYSIDGGKNWQDKGVFSGLNPASDYEVVTRVKETATSKASPASEALKTTTDKASVAAPAKPELLEAASDSITVKAGNGQEYSIDGGKNWQDKGVFSGLKPVTEYEIITRIKETSSSKSSPASKPLKAKTVKASVAAPAKPELQEATSDSITVKTVKGQEYSIDGGKNWQDKGVFSGLKPVTSYEIITRVKETASSKGSPASKPLAVTTDKTSVAAPAKPELQETTSDSITVKAVKGQEYSIDNGKNWQDKGVFSGLKPATSYEIITRIKETDTSYASKNSEVLKVTTNEKSSVTKEKTDPKKPSAVKTGDTATTGFWILLITFSAGMIIFFAGINRRKKNKRS